MKINYVFLYIIIGIIFAVIIGFLIYRNSSSPKSSINNLSSKLNELSVASSTPNTPAKDVQVAVNNTKEATMEVIKDASNIISDIKSTKPSATILKNVENVSDILKKSEIIVSSTDNPTAILNIGEDTEIAFDKAQAIKAAAAKDEELKAQAIRISYAKEQVEKVQVLLTDFNLSISNAKDEVEKIKKNVIIAKSEAEESDKKTKEALNDANNILEENNYITSVKNAEVEYNQAKDELNRLKSELFGVRNILFNNGVGIADIQNHPDHKDAKDKVIAANDKILYASFNVRSVKAPHTNAVDLYNQAKASSQAKNNAVKKAEDEQIKAEESLKEYEVKANTLKELLKYKQKQAEDEQTKYNQI